MRAVLDTNVWTGAILRRSAAHTIYLRAEAGEYTAVTSHPILHEIVRVLRAYFALPDDSTYQWWLRLTRLCDVVQVFSLLNVIERDPDDNKFIECALDGRCEYIVSQDGDLLDLGSYAGMQIVKVGRFLRLLESLS
jgi:putative PIN family toxin of toxin-antitoxin system